MREKLRFVFLLCAFRVADGFVYSCEEVNSSILISDQLQISHAFIRKKVLADLSRSTNPGFGKYSPTKWRVVASNAAKLDCYQEFIILFSDGEPLNLFGIVTAKYNSQYMEITEDQGLSSPQSGMRIRPTKCTGSGEVQFFTGFGNGTDEERFPLHSWRCSDIPDYIISFDVAVTILQSGSFGFHYELHNGNSEIELSPGDKVAIITSGRSDNLQSKTPDRNIVKFKTNDYVTVSTSYDLTFDTRYNGDISIVTPGNQKKFSNGSGNYDFTTTSFEVHYNSIAIPANQIGNSQDNVVIEMTTIAATAPPPPEKSDGSYCDCALDRFYMADGWETTEIWIDVVIILDTSEAMGENSLSDATLIESLIGDDTTDYDVLITDPNAQFYTRVGLIAMSNKAEVLYNLNMTKYDKVMDKAKITTGVTEINVIDAFDAALSMFNGGLVSQPDRKDARQVIYYMTGTNPKTDLSPVNQFKASNGIIIVNNYQMHGQLDEPGLQELASDGYYFTGIQENFMFTIEAFCKANCFCKADRQPYAGAVNDPATNAAGGCYHVAPSGVPFGKAREACKNNRGGLVASAHDNVKATYLNDLLISVMPVPKPYFFWIGYSKLVDGTTWKWEDGSSDPFTNWAAGEPNPSTVSKCAYVDQSSPQLQWGAGNCQVGFPYICEYAPCSAGNKNC